MIKFTHYTRHNSEHYIYLAQSVGWNQFKTQSQELIPIIVIV